MSQPSWPGPIAAITLFVEDLAAAKSFYSALFDRPVRFEDANSAVFDLPNTLINLLTAGAVPELIAPAVAGSGPRCVFTIGVPDVDAMCARLAALGVQLLNGPMDRPWGIRTASFQDPAGHIWEIAQ